MSRTHRSRVVLLLLASAIAGACDDTPNDPRAQIHSVTLSSNALEVEMGSIRTVKATVKDGRGAVRGDVAVTWSTSNAAVATVRGAGEIVAVSPGTATIAAAAGSRRASVAVTVTAPIASVEAGAEAVQLDVGTTHQLRPRVRDADGRLRDDVPISWRSTDASVATVSPSGMITAHFPGRVVLYVSAAGRSDSTVVTVVAPIASVTVMPAQLFVDSGVPTPLIMHVRDVLGRLRADVPVSWTSADTSLVRVSDTGVVTGMVYSRGTNVTATAGGRSANAFVFVQSRASHTFRYEATIFQQRRDGSKYWLYVTATGELREGYDMLDGRRIHFGTSAALTYHARAEGPAGSGCTARVEVRPGRLDLVISSENRGAAGRLQAHVRPLTQPPTELTHWSCPGGSPIEQSRLLASALEALYGRAAADGFATLADGTDRAVVDRTIETETLTIREVATLTITPVR